MSTFAYHSTRCMIDSLCQQYRIVHDDRTCRTAALLSSRLQDQAGAHLDPQVFVVPAGVQCEWHAGKDHIEIFVDTDGDTALWWEDADGDHDVEIKDSGRLPDGASQTLRRITERTGKGT